MSLILEALRKSEAERRRGDAPDLRAELPPPAAPGRRIPPTPWIVGGALLLLFVLGALWAPGDDTADGDRPDGAGRAEDLAVSDGHSPGDGSPAATVPSASLSGSGVPQGSGRASREPSFPSVERIRAPAPPPTQAPGPMPIPARVAVPVDAADAAQAPAAAETAADQALRISGLSSSQRARLPELKLSLHMWNQDPARRFVVIDGQRRVEGDRLGEATMTAIDRDGVLLELDGQVLRIPLP